MKIVGVDAGSTVLKVVILNENKIEILRSYAIAGDPISATKLMLKEISCDNCFFCVTGSSRKLVGDYLGALIIKPEIIAHLRGLTFPPKGKNLVFEIGGQDSKMLIVENGEMKNFKMNSNCAAGTGSFIEAQARRFNMSVDEFDALASTSSEAPININTKCATFLESALINLQRQGINRSTLASTVFFSLARNYIDTMCEDIFFNEYEKIFFVGGVAKISTMKKSFEILLGKEIVVPENCEYNGAIGIAKILYLSLKNMRNEVRNDEKIQCEDCDNKCVLTKVMVNGYIEYTGGVCGKYKYY